MKRGCRECNTNCVFSLGATGVQQVLMTLSRMVLPARVDVLLGVWRLLKMFSSSDSLLYTTGSMADGRL